MRSSGPKPNALVPVTFSLTPTVCHVPPVEGRSRQYDETGMNVGVCRVQYGCCCEQRVDALARTNTPVAYPPTICPPRAATEQQWYYTAPPTAPPQCNCLSGCYRGCHDRSRSFPTRGSVYLVMSRKDLLRR